MSAVYLIRDSSKDNVYKIGVTRGNLEKRIKKLQTGNSGEIHLVKSYETIYPFFIEKKLHKLFENKKVINEWFELTMDDVCSFEEKCKEIEELIELMKDNPFFPKNIR